jgi:hypothetical protein
VDDGRGEQQVDNRLCFSPLCFVLPFIDTPDKARLAYLEIEVFLSPQKQEHVK